MPCAHTNWRPIIMRTRANMQTHKVRTCGEKANATNFNLSLSRLGKNRPRFRRRVPSIGASPSEGLGLFVLMLLTLLVSCLPVRVALAVEGKPLSISAVREIQALE